MALLDRVSDNKGIEYTVHLDRLNSPRRYRPIFIPKPHTADDCCQTLPWRTLMSAILSPSSSQAGHLVKPRLVGFNWKQLLLTSLRQTSGDEEMLSPANTRHSRNVISMLGQRRKRWANMEITLRECLVFAERTLKNTLNVPYFFP